MGAPSTLTCEDWRALGGPDYVQVLMWRQDRIRRLLDDRQLAVNAHEFYRVSPVDFINHWCMTYDPRNAGRGAPTKLPFVLFERQAEMVEFVVGCIRAECSGLIEKSREMGATWLCCAMSVWLWLYWPGASVGWGSNVEVKLDKIGVPDTVFEKMRIIIRELPRLLWPRGFDPLSHMTFMRIINPENGATITGESGDNIGRGGRKLIYFKDESAHYEHPEAIEAALCDNTRVQIDISSVNGLGNVFNRRREAGVDWSPGCVMERDRTYVFVFDWRDHPLKTEEWYTRRRQEFVDKGMLHIFAQEVDRNYSAAVDGIVIPAEWVRAAVDAHIRLGFDDSGAWCAGLDVADGGGDTNALALRRGVVLRSVVEWGERDTGVTARRAVSSCSGLGDISLQYDCVGVGAGVKAETNRLIDEGLMPRNVFLVPWDAGAGVLQPEGRVVEFDRDSPRNKDFYANLKAQGWWMLRRRFENTYRAITDPGFTWDGGDLISLDRRMPLLRKLEKELSQVTAGQGARLKLVIDKTPEGTRSPNLADAVMMCYWPAPSRRSMAISDAVLQRSVMCGVHA